MLDFEIPDPTLRRELHSLGQLIGAKETEQNWQSIDKAVAKLTALFVQAAQSPTAAQDASYTQSLFKFVKAKRTNMVAYLKTERTSFSGTACKLIESIATHFASNQHSPDELFLEPLISLTSRTNKLFQQRSTAALLAIMASASSDLIVPKLAEAAKHKSAPTRLSVTQCFKRLLEVDQDRPDKLESHTPSIEAALKLLTQDAVAQVRELARTTVALYMKMFPTRANLFLNTLTPAVRKALGGAGSTTSTPAASKPISKRPPIPRPRPAPGASGPTGDDAIIIHAPPRPPPSASMRAPAPTTAATTSSTHAPASSTRRISHSTGHPVHSSAAIRALQSQSRSATAAAAAPHTPLPTIKSGVSSAPAITTTTTPAPHASITLTQFLITSSSTSYTQRFHAFDSAALHLLPHSLPLTPDDHKLIARHISHGLASTHPKPLAAALGNVTTMVQRGVITGTALTKVVAKVAQLAHTAEYACRPTIMDPVRAILEAVGTGTRPEDLGHVVAARTDLGPATADAEASRAVVTALVARIVERLGVVGASKAIIVGEGEGKAEAAVDTVCQMIAGADDTAAQKLLAKWVFVLQRGCVKEENVKKLAHLDTADGELDALIEHVFAPPAEPETPAPVEQSLPSVTPKRAAQKPPPTTPGTVFREPGLPASRMIGTPAPPVGPMHVSTPFSVAAAAAKSPALTATPLGIFSPAMPDVASMRKRTLTPGAMLGMTPVKSVKRTRGDNGEVAGDDDEGASESPTKRTKRARMESAEAGKQEDQMDVDQQPEAQQQAEQQVSPIEMAGLEPIDDMTVDPSMLSPAVVDVTALLATAAELEAAGESGLEHVFQAALDDVNYDLMLLDRTPLTDLLVYLDKCNDLSDELIAALLHFIHAELASSLSSADTNIHQPATLTDGERRIRTLTLLQQLLKQMSAAQLPTHIGEFLLSALFTPPTPAQLGSLHSRDTAHHEHMLRSETQVFLCALLPVDRVLAVLAAHTQGAPVTVYALLMHLLQRAPAVVLPRLAEWMLVYVLDAVVLTKGYRADAAAGFVSWVATTLGEKGREAVHEAIRLAQDKKDSEWGSRLIERLEVKGVQSGEGLVFLEPVGGSVSEENVEVEKAGEVEASEEMQVDEVVIADASKGKREEGSTEGTDENGEIAGS